MDFYVSSSDATVVGSADLECGFLSGSGVKKDREKKIALSSSAGWVDVSRFTVESGGGHEGCPTSSELPLRSSTCRGGATLSIR